MNPSQRRITYETYMYNVDRNLWVSPPVCARFHLSPERKDTFGIPFSSPKYKKYISYNIYVKL